MGGVVDTGIFVAYERRGWNGRRAVSHLSTTYPNRIVITSVTVAELVHAIYRAKTKEQRERRRDFVKDIIAALPPVPFTETTAWIAGRIRGEQATLGNTLPLADSLIAAAALEIGYEVITLNVSDFTRIPELRVVAFSTP